MMTITSPKNRLITAACVVVVLFSILILRGCKGPEARFVGKWQGPAIEGPLTLAADRTFSLPVGSTGQQYAGSWAVDGNKLTLKIEKIDGVSPNQYFDDLARKNPGRINQTMVDKLKEAGPEAPTTCDLTISEDGKTLTTSAVGNGETITYTRASD
jgi:hypothetical protein